MVWNSNIPLIGNLVAEDLLDINENFAHLINLIGDIDGSAFPANNNIVQFDGSQGLEDSGQSVSTIGVLDTASEWTARQNFNEASLTSSSNSVAWDLNTAQCAVHTLTENTTIAEPTNMLAGITGYITVFQAAGVYTLDWNAAFVWGTRTKSSAPAADGDYITVSYKCNGTTMEMGEFIRVEA